MNPDLVHNGINFTRVELASQIRKHDEIIKTLDERVQHICSLDLDPRMEYHLLAECFDRLRMRNRARLYCKRRLDMLSRC